MRAQSSNNRQGRGDLLEVDQANRILSILQEDALNSYTHYEEMLNENFSGETIDENKTGLARELARMNLSLGFYTQWYWKIDLHNLLHFLSLRADEHAQYEIRVYAEAIMETVKRWCPITYDAFIDHRVNSVTLSGKAIQVIKKMIDGTSIDQEESGLSKREWRELMGVLEKLD